MGRSRRADMIRVFGKPKFSELFAEDGSQPEDWYHYDDAGEFRGELVVNVDNLTGRILRMTLQPKSFTPAATWPNNAWPFNVRQFCSAVLVNLKTIARMPARETQPRVLVVRKRTVAKVDSIGFVVRMCSQCSAGKS